MEYQKPFIYIDTNFNPSDALFIKMALDSFEFELVGLSANRSFMSSAAAGENILGLVNSEDLFLSVARNYDDKKSEKDRKIFNPQADYLEDMDAYHNLYDIASDCGRLDIIATGDLSNIAKSIRRYEEIVDYIDHIFMVLPDIGKTSENDLNDLDLILSSGIKLFLIDQKFTEDFTLTGENLGKPKAEGKTLRKVLEDYDGQALTGPLLLYLSQSPEAFIFEERGLRVNFAEKIITKDSKRPKAYLVNKVNEESFYDYLKSKL